MVSSAMELAAALLGTALEGRHVGVVEVPGTTEVVLTVGVAPLDRWADWRVARDLVDRTRRWPVVVNSFDVEGPRGSPDRLRPWGGSGSSADADLSVPSILERASSVNARAAIASLEADYDRIAPPFLPNEVYATNVNVGDAPTEGEIRAGIGDAVTHRAVDHWLLEWEVSRGAALPVRHIEPSEGDWIDGMGDDWLLAFLPTHQAWATPAFFGFWTWDYDDGRADQLVAIERSWFDRFGAEVVSSTGTSLEFTIARPPVTLAEAYDLAWEHYLVAPCTLALGGVAVRDHARSLVGSQVWYLHERP